MRTLGSVAAVTEAVRDDAAARVELIRRDTQSTLAAVHREGAAPAEDASERDARLAAARRAAHERLARAEWEDRRADLEEREAWIKQACRDGIERLTAAGKEERRRDLLVLAREALQRIPDADCEVLLAEEDLGLLDAPDADDLARLTGKRRVQLVRAVDAAGEPPGGCLARSVDRKVSFDNRYTARVRRLEPMWRMALAQLYESADTGRDQPASS